MIYLSLFNGNKIKQNPCFLLVCFNLQIERFFFGSEHEVMALITPHIIIHKFVHKQNIGYFLFVVVLLNQSKRTSFYQITVLSILIFFEKTSRHYRTVKNASVQATEYYVI